MLNLFGRGEKRERRRRAEDALLIRYLDPRPLPSRGAQESWEESLGKSYRRAIRQLVAEGDLRRPTIREGLQFARVKDIKPVLKKLGLKVSGRKSGLIERLVDEAPEEAKRLASEHAQDVFGVTDSGRERALSFQQDRERLRREAEQDAHDALKRGDLRRASDAVNEFFRWLPANLRPGMSMNWDDRRGGVDAGAGQVKHILKGASESWVVREIPEDLRDKILLYAAEDALWPDGLPDDRPYVSPEEAERLEQPVDTYVNLIRSWGHSAVTREAQDELGGTRVWHTAADKHVCEMCAPLDLAPEKYWKDRFPHGPPAHDGCRCSTGLTYQSDAQLEKKWRRRQKMLREEVEGWGGEKP